MAPQNSTGFLCRDWVDAQSGTALIGYTQMVRHCQWSTQPRARISPGALASPITMQAFRTVPRSTTWNIQAYPMTDVAQIFQFFVRRQYTECCNSNYSAWLIKLIHIWENIFGKIVKDSIIRLGPNYMIKEDFKETQ